MRHKLSYKFTSLASVDVPNFFGVVARLLISFFTFAVLTLAITPWQQTSQGSGKIIAFDPNDRVQDITTNIPGRIKKWYVNDGSKVKAGDPIVEIVDNDPNLIKRLRLERDAIFRRYEVAKEASETSFLNFERQQKLFEQGLSSRKEFEKAKIEYKKLLATESTAAANLAKAEVNLSRQDNQIVTAPRDGTILRVLLGSGSIFVKTGDVLASFVPASADQAVEVYISGNDLPLVYPGRKVRLQFEGWPAVQFSGWPSVAIGTFGGVVQIVDPSASANGKFRVLIKPDEGEDWPDNKYLRPGTRVYGWILLNTVKLGYELWRQFNGFPASLNKSPEEVEAIKDSHRRSKEREQNTYKGNQ